MTDPRATVREIDGQLVLADPDALAVIRAVHKHQCRAIARAQSERVAHFVGRMAAKGLTGKEVVIVLINADDRYGHELANVLMPTTDWQPFRDRGEVPFARGLARREGIESALALFDEHAANKLRAHDGIAVVVVDHGVAEVCAPESAR